MVVWRSATCGVIVVVTGRIVVSILWKEKRVLLTNQRQTGQDSVQFIVQQLHLCPRVM